MTICAPKIRIHVALASPLPQDGYYFVKRDWEVDEYKPGIRDLGTDKDGNPRSGIPMVFRCGTITNNRDGHYTFLTKDWQFFSFNLLALSYYKRTYETLSAAEYDWLANRWKGLYDGSTAFTNGHGTDTGRNYVARNKDDQNLGAEDPKIYTLICGGASLRGTIETNALGRQMLKADHFDGNHPPPDIKTINLATDPRIFFATTITNTKAAVGYKVRPFAYLENDATGEVFDVPIPLIAGTDIYYPLADTRWVPGAKAKPYNP